MSRKQKKKGKHKKGKDKQVDCAGGFTVAEALAAKGIDPLEYLREERRLDRDIQRGRTAVADAMDDLWGSGTPHDVKLFYLDHLEKVVRTEIESPSGQNPFCNYQS